MGTKDAGGEATFICHQSPKRIIDTKAKELGISKSGVVELSLRELDKKNSVN